MLALAILTIGVQASADKFTVRSTWQGTVFGRERTCRGITGTPSFPNCPDYRPIFGDAARIDGSRIRCGNRIITFGTFAVPVWDGERWIAALETKGQLCKRGQSRRHCGCLSYPVVTGDFMLGITGSPTGAFVSAYGAGLVRTLDAGASYGRGFSINPSAISLRRVKGPCNVFGCL
jgi:hypothetical protein